MGLLSNTAVLDELADPVEVYEAAFHAYGEFVAPDSPCVEITFDVAHWDVQDLLHPELAAIWVEQRQELRLRWLEEYHRLRLYVWHTGEAESQKGTYVIDGYGRLVYRPHRSAFTLGEPPWN